MLFILFPGFALFVCTSDHFPKMPSGTNMPSVAASTTAYAHSNFYAGGRSSSFDTEDGGEVYLQSSELYLAPDHLGTPRKNAQEHDLETPNKKARTRARREVRKGQRKQSTGEAATLQYASYFVLVAKMKIIQCVYIRC